MEVRDDLFAGTPLLAALRMMLSQAASRGASRSRRVRFKVIDVKKASLYGIMERVLYVELPEQDSKAKEKNEKGKS